MTVLLAVEVTDAGMETGTTALSPAATTTIAGLETAYISCFLLAGSCMCLYSLQQTARRMIIKQQPPIAPTTIPAIAALDSDDEENVM